MKQRKSIFLSVLALGFMGVFLLSACTSSATSQDSPDQEDLPVVTVYKSPT